MLKQLQHKFRDAGFLATEIGLITIWGGALLLALILPERIFVPLLTWDDLRFALSFSALFMVLSGFIFTLLILHAQYTYRQSWVTRSALNATLFLVHFLAFGLMFGAYFGSRELLLMLAGAIGVAVASALASFVWRGRRP